MVDRAANGKPRRTDLSRHLEEVVYPALYDRLEDAFPEFAFAQRGAVKEATRWPAGFPLEVEHPRPERLQCYADSPYRLWVHGRHHLRWLDYVNGGRKPMGPDFLAAVRKLCDLAGVQFPEREVSAEEEEQARAWEMRRALLATVLASCQEVLWSPRGDQARAYMGSRGFTDDDMKALGLGFYPGVDDLRSHLEANGHDARAADNCRLLVPELTGYIVLPWNDPSGGPMTLYGRWAGAELPSKRAHPGWARSRDRDRREWEGKPDVFKEAAPWVEPTIPKTYALPGANTKSSPLFFDRARRAGHRDTIVAVEGLFDGTMLQCRGETSAVAYVAAEFSQQQVETLARYQVRRVILVPDPDGGGDHGARSSIKKLRARGIEAYVAKRLPDGLDPDEFLVRFGVDGWRQHIADPVPGVRHEAEWLLAGITPADPEIERRESAGKLARFARGLNSSLDREEVIRIAGERTGFGAEAIRELADGMFDGSKADCSGRTETLANPSAGDAREGSENGFKPSAGAERDAAEAFDQGRPGENGRPRKDAGKAPGSLRRARGSSGKKCGRDRDREDDPRETQAQALLRLAGDAYLFHDESGRTFATVSVDSHRETHVIRSTSFRRWLTRAFYVEQRSPPSSEALQSALNVLESKAQYDGPLEKVWTRVAAGPLRITPDDPTYYLDLCNPQWQAVEITRRGWRVIDDPPVKFRRAKGMSALPLPERGGSIEDLRPFVNLPTDPDWWLFIACLAASLRPQGPYPILAVSGEQGSAKSTTVRVARRLIDPNATLLRCEPKEVRDLMIAATNAWAVTLDNLSSLPDWLSDALCRLATGGGFATRTLYADDEETHFDAMRPVLLNGIEDIATKYDLLDRSIMLTLPWIPEEKRREEEPFWRAFEAAHPKILGALLDAVVGGLKELPAVKLDRLPRMADFARWGEAVGRALGWEPGAFLAAYEGNRTAANATALEASPVAVAVRQLFEKEGNFDGTSTDLLEKLNRIVSEKATKAKGWPANARALSGQLRRLAPALRKLGIVVEFPRAAGGNRRRHVTIEGPRPEKARDSASHAVLRPRSPIEEHVSPEDNLSCDEPKGGTQTGAPNSEGEFASRGCVPPAPGAGPPEGETTGTQGGTQTSGDDFASRLASRPSENHNVNQGKELDGGPGARWDAKPPGTQNSPDLLPPPLRHTDQEDPHVTHGDARKGGTPKPAAILAFDTPRGDAGAVGTQNPAAILEFDAPREPVEPTAEASDDWKEVLL